VLTINRELLLYGRLRDPVMRSDADVIFLNDHSFRCGAESVDGKRLMWRLNSTRCSDACILSSISDCNWFLTEFITWHSIHKYLC